jgi:NAD(P)-dependent dehydrogenase (short-subunit alcohol dehydrogenase family)
VLDAGGKMVSLAPCDVTDLNCCKELVQLAVTEFGGIDILINNAGYLVRGTIEEMSVKDWNATIAGELNHVFTMTKAAWSELAVHGGTIVNISSTACVFAAPLAHAAAKAGVVAMTRGLAKEGAKSGIRANSITPGWFQTPASDVLVKSNPEWGRQRLQRIMRGTPGTLDEIVNVILFFSSELSSYVTAADLIVDGGMTQNLFA